MVDVQESTEMTCAFGGALRLVLVEPQDGRNVGAIGRLCANFGVHSVYLVSRGQIARHRQRQCQGYQQSCNADDEDARDDAEVEEESIHEEVPAAEKSSSMTELEVFPFSWSYWKRAKPLATADGVPLIEQFKVVDSLQHALLDCGTAVAFTGREGDNFRPPRVDYRNLWSLLPSDSSGETSGSRAAAPLALVFGREDCGLKMEELMCCSHCCTISTHSCGSLNLSHAVAVVLARLFEDRISGPVLDPSKLRYESSLKEGNQEASVRPNSVDSFRNSGDEDGSTTQAAGAAEVNNLLEKVKKLLEARGYPVGRTSKERREKFCFRILKHIASTARILHRARATPQELEAVQKLFELLGEEDPRKRLVNSKRKRTDEGDSVCDSERPKGPDHAIAPSEVAPHAS